MWKSFTVYAAYKNYEKNVSKLECESQYRDDFFKSTYI